MKTATKISILAATALGLSSALFVIAGWYFSISIVTPYRLSLEETVARFKVRSFEEFRLPSPVEHSVVVDGTRLKFWYFENRAGSNCAVIASHGYSGNRYGGLKYASLFHQFGCHVLTADSRAHGESDGEFNTWGHNEKHDLVVLLDWLEQKTNLPRRQMGLIGESMGGAISLQAAALQPDLAFVIADSAFHDLSAILERQGVRRFGGVVPYLLPLAERIADWRAGFNVGEIRPSGVAAQLEMPVLLVHSLQDTFTPPQHSQVIYDAVPHQRKELQFTDWGAKHGHSINVDIPAYEAMLRQFLRIHVPHWVLTDG